jgi:hypothetical protein
MTIIRARASIRQSMNGDERSVTVSIDIGSEGTGPAQGQLGWAKVGQLSMAAEDWRALRSVLTIPDYHHDDGPDVAITIEELPIGVTGEFADERNEVELDKIIGELYERRQAQDYEHGGPDHDDLHTWGDWSGFCQKFVSRSLQAISHADFERDMLHIAALAVAAIESSRRKSARSAARFAASIEGGKQEV